MNNKNDIKKIIILIIVALCCYFLISNIEFVIKIINRILDALFPFILGIILAFILNIPMMKIENFLEKIQKEFKIKFKTRGISIIVSLIIFLLIIAFISFNLIPELINNIESLIKSLPSIINNTKNYTLNLLKDFPSIQARINNIFINNKDIDDIIVSVLNYIINGSVGFITSLISSLITIFTSLIFAIYMLHQKEYLLNGMEKVLKAYSKKNISNKVINICKLANNTFSKFVTGQCLEAVILGAIVFIVLTIFKFPYALLISTLTAITALIPIFGSLIAGGVGAVLIATVNPIRGLIFIVLFIIIQQLENNLIYPKVVGKSVGLSPIWTLLAVTLGGSLFGIMGMLIGLPVASILYALLKKDVNNKLTSK